jgi:hypothetical protein
VHVWPTTTLGQGGSWPSWLSAPAARWFLLPCPALAKRAHGDRLLRGCRWPARLAVVGDEVLHGGHGEGEYETGEPFLGADGSGTLPVRASDDDTIAPSSTSGLRTSATMGTCVGRWRRGERRCQRGDDDDAWWHGSSGTARTGSGGVRRSDMWPRVRQLSASDRGMVDWRLYIGVRTTDSTAPLGQSADGVWWLSR